MRHIPVRARPGVTLVELLIVIAIIGLLSTMVVIFGPTLGEKQRASRGADQLQGWLFLAKQRALRDQKPRGLRLLPDSTSTFATTVQGASGVFVRQLQLIEQPEPLQGVIQFLIPAPATTTVPQNTCYLIADVYPPPPNTFGTADYTGLVNQPLNPGAPSSVPRHYDVNDILQIGTESFRIINLNPQLWKLPQTPSATFPPQPLPNNYGTPPDLVPPQYLGKTWQQLLDANYNADSNHVRHGTLFQLDHWPVGHNFQDNEALKFVGKTFSVIRAPQPLAGEATLDMPRDIAIDLSRSYPGGGAGGFLHDIMFAPSGKVVGQFSGFGRLCLWVRDVSLFPAPDTARQTSPFLMSKNVLDAGGTHVLITIYTRTGKIAGQEVNPSVDSTGQYLADPFLFTKDGLSSGL